MSRKVIIYEMIWSGDNKRYERTPTKTGIFHQFGLRMEEDERGFTSESAAIVELEDGNVITPRADLIQFVRDDKPANDDQFYLQDSRDYVGNSMLFWRKGGGYTTDLTQAEVFPKDSALKQHRDRDTDMQWSKEYIDSLAKPVVDTQVADRSLLKDWLGI